jgi:hypothetical protein
MFWSLWYLPKSTADWVVPPLLVAFLDLLTGLFIGLWVYGWSGDGVYYLSHWGIVFAFPAFIALLLGLLFMDFVEFRSRTECSRYFEMAGGHILLFVATASVLAIFALLAILDARLGDN